MKQLERLLFLQGNRCFFCQSAIPAGEASVEHLVASVNGGANSDDNCVVCCKGMNEALGKLPIKTKMQVILNHHGRFQCPCRKVARSVPDLYEPVDDGFDPVDAVEPSDEFLPPEACQKCYIPDPPFIEQKKRVELVINHLRQARNRPLKIKGLKNTIKSLLGKTLPTHDVNLIIDDLQMAGYVAIVADKLQYSFA